MTEEAGRGESLRDVVAPVDTSTSRARQPKGGLDTARQAPRVRRFGLGIAPALADFVDAELLPSSGVHPDAFWQGLAALVEQFGPRNRDLLDTRARLQAKIDQWHREQGGVGAPSEYQAFLSEIGYLHEEGADFSVDTSRIDREVAGVAAPQLVVPLTNARYAINAANARWGSLYDAVYGTDVLGDLPPAGPYDVERGRRVIAWGRAFLDDMFPLVDGSHDQVVGYRVIDGCLEAERRDGAVTALRAAGQLAGHAGSADRPATILLRHHGLHVEVVIDRDHPVGQDDLAGVSDLRLEAAVTVIMDCEDAVATVDAADKIVAYRNWLGLMQGSLTTEVAKDGNVFTRRLHEAKEYVSPTGDPVVLSGLGLMLVRNVGLHLSTDAVIDAAEQPIPEGLLDAMVTVAAAMHDLARPSDQRNSPAGSIYVVKPKLHGPAEAEFVDDLFTAVEATLGLDPFTVKLGLMDEERRTSVNLKECIRAIRHRVAFINTGFLDRTGDEIHTSMEAGAMVRKAEMKSAPWIDAYEDGNVEVGLACGLAGRGQIGKGMWAAPDRMEAMLADKISHPLAGATCAWVPSPTAATLHATHYHRVDAFSLHDEIRSRPRATRDALLTPPVSLAPLSDAERISELENNAQGILGYVARWVQHGIGCSKVPDIHGVALMEDRATCRISSQHIANWLHHGVTTQSEVEDVFRRMAVVVDQQNADDPTYRPMGPHGAGHAFTAALALVLEGRSQPNGYTEWILADHRRAEKAETNGDDA